MPAVSSSAKTVHALFEQCAQRTPHAIAVVCRHERLTYDELNRRANRLAHLLLAQGIEPGERIGVHCERSLEMIVALLAILKAGGVYVPLDPSYPERRLSFMMEDTRAQLLLTQRSLPPIGGRRPIYLDEEEAFDRFSEKNIPPIAGADDLAYVIYTSGSTGRPKGVQIPHRGIVRLLFGVDYARFGADRVFLQLAPLSFDASTFEIWGPLLHGGICVLYPERLPTLEGLQRILFEHDVTTLWLTASLYNLVIEQAPHALARVQELLVGGEALSVRHVRRGLELLPHTQIINGYGPTECTTFACCYRIPRDETAARIPIGRPIGRTEAYVLSEELRPVQTGEPGELFLGGEGLARGYLNAPERTTERFVEIHVEGSLRRLYRTGDLVRWRDDGELEFLGRLDQQVKIRGFRIELQEVEAAITELPFVSQCAVVCHEVSPGNKRLYAYVVMATACGAERLWADLQKIVPDHMIPSQFVFLDALPLTPNGKVDRAKLAHPSQMPEEEHPQREIEASATERLLLDLWRELFGNVEIAPEDDFFLSGGDSLMAVRLVAEIDRRTGRSLPLEVLLHARTVAQLAAVLEQGDWEPPCSHLVPIQPGGKRAPLFCVPGLGGHAFMFHELSQALGTDQPVFALQLADSNSTRAATRSMEHIAASCLEEVRSVQPRGPYQLLGYSLGGTVAFEMAQQLHASGDEVAFLGLLDSDGPRYPRTSSRAVRSLLHLQHAMRLNRSERIAYVSKRLRNVMRKLRKRPPAVVAAASAGNAENHIRSAMQSLERTAFPLYRSWLAYVPQFYPGGATVFRAANVPQHLGMDHSDQLMGWGNVTARAEACVVPGSHGDVHRVPNAHVLAARIRERLHPAASSADHALQKALFAERAASLEASGS